MESQASSPDKPPFLPQPAQVISSGAKLPFPDPVVGLQGKCLTGEESGFNDSSKTLVFQLSGPLHQESNSQ